MSANTNIYTIYKATNILNGKAYVGFDSHWPIRIRGHFHSAKSKTDKMIFHSSIRKHGLNSFQWDILYQSKNRNHTLQVMEEHFIREYHSHISEGGYNMTYGGEGTEGYIRPIENRIQISKKLKGRKLSFQHIENIRKYKMTPEHREKIRLAATGRKLSIETKKKLSQIKLKFYAKQ